MPEQSNDEEKDLAFYSAALTASFNTRLQRDKSILTFSLAGIGLLVTLLTTIGPSSFIHAFIYFLSTICFVVAAITTILIFGRNSKYIEGVLIRNQKTDCLLKVYDKIAIGSFFIGIGLAFLVALISVNNDFNKEGLPLKKDFAPKSSTNIKKNSFDGIEKFKSPIVCKLKKNPNTLRRSQ